MQTPAGPPKATKKPKGPAFTPPQYERHNPANYYRSAEEESIHPLAQIDFCNDYIDKGCSKGNNCRQRHIYYKQLRSELKAIQAPYKKHLCKTFESGNKCTKPKYQCLFAHGEDDIWCSRFKEFPASQINQTSVDERLKKTAPQQQYQPQQQQQNPQKNQVKNQVQKPHKGESQNLPHTQPKKQNKLQEFDVESTKNTEKAKKQPNQQVAQVAEVVDLRNNRVRSQKIPQPQNHIKQSSKPVQSRSNQPISLSIQNNQRGVSSERVQSKRSNGKNTAVTNDWGELQMSDEQFEQYLLQMKEEQLMNENGDGGDDDDDDFEDENSKEGSNEEWESDSEAAEDHSHEEEEEEDDDEDLKEKKKDPKSNRDKKVLKNRKQSDNIQQQDYNDFKKINWNKIDPEKMTNEQLMQLNAAYIANQSDSGSNDDYYGEEDDDKEKVNGNCNKLKKPKQVYVKPKEVQKKQIQTASSSDENLSEFDRKMLERKEQRKLKKEEKKLQKQKDRQLNGGIQFQSPASTGNSSQEDSIQQFMPDQIEFYCFCYYQTEEEMSKWREIFLDVLFELQIPKNALVIQEDNRCDGEFGILIRLKSLRVIALQLLRINLYKAERVKLLFKISPNPDTQIVFSKPIKAVNRINEYSFLGQDGKNHIVFNSKIEAAESESLEFKNYDFRNINDNTRKLEEVITGMLNREDYAPQGSKEQEQQLSGKIFLGIKDSTRQFIGCNTSNNHHETFFSFLSKRLRDCTPPVGPNLYSREEYRLVIPGETENIFFPILDQKVFVINIEKPAKNTIYQSSSGLYFQKIEEGNWPMSAHTLYENQQKNIISEERLRIALKNLDRRYFFIMVKMASQNQILQNEFANNNQHQEWE